MTRTADTTPGRPGDIGVIAVSLGAVGLFGVPAYAALAVDPVIVLRNCQPVGRESSRALAHG